MAETQHSAAHDTGMDYAEHERTYRMFTTLVKNVATAIVILLVVLAYFLL